MAVELSEDQKKALKEAFAFFDQSGDGKISKDELRNALKQMGRDPSEEDLQALIAHVDKDNSGSIDYAEFEQVVKELYAMVQARVKEAFDSIDTDGNGFISVGEMDTLFKSLGYELTAEQLKEELAKVDLNSDGKISLDEFKQMLAAL